MKQCLLLLLLTSLAAAQSTGPQSESIAIGHESLACPTCPEAPAPQPKTKWHYLGEPIEKDMTSFWAFRSNWKTPLLKPNKKSWVIWSLSHAVGWGAMIAACRNPRSGETWGSEAGAMAAVTAFDFGTMKFFSPAMGTPGGLYAAGHYIYSDLK